MTRIVTVVGARPQFIKAAPVSRALATHPEVEEILVHTGQHYDAGMSEIFFEELDIPRPRHNLGVGGGPHGQMTGRQLEKIEEVLVSERPDTVLVYGDTNSTMAGALAASKLGIRVAHVEAGMRSWNRAMPEEINRIVTDHVSDLFLVPSGVARENLLREGIDDERIHVVGDVMYDAALYYSDRARPPVFAEELALESEGFVLVTLHRPQNTDQPDRLAAIVEGLGASGRTIVWPVHPRTQQRLDESDIEVPKSIRLTPPVGYLEMVWLQSRCSMVATDSGGVQKEAFFHRKPCITLREETEWVELVEGGYQCLVGSDPRKIEAALHDFRMPPVRSHPYGEGDASAKIALALQNRADVA